MSWKFDPSSGLSWLLHLSAPDPRMNSSECGIMLGGIMLGGPL